MTLEGCVLLNMCSNPHSHCMYMYMCDTVSEATGQVVASTQSGADVTRKNST